MGLEGGATNALQLIKSEAFLPGARLLNLNDGYIHARGFKGAINSSNARRRIDTGKVFESVQ